VPPFFPTKSKRAKEPEALLRLHGGTGRTLTGTALMQFSRARRGQPSALPRCDI
jgi:hypothetical protein